MDSPSNSPIGRKAREVRAASPPPACPMPPPARPGVVEMPTPSMPPHMVVQCLGCYKVHPAGAPCFPSALAGNFGMHPPPPPPPGMHFGPRVQFGPPPPPPRQRMPHPPPFPPVMEGVHAPSRPLSPISDEDGDTVTGSRRRDDDDNISLASSYYLPLDRGWNSLSADENTKVVYEAYEVVLAEDTLVSSTWRTFAGMNFGTHWKALNDGTFALNPLCTYDQGELSDMYTEAVDKYAQEKGKKAKNVSYLQDLANRVFRVPSDVHNKIHMLIESRTDATNRNPRRQREWKVVLMREEELPLTELAPERKKKRFFGKRPKAAIQRWFFVVQGEEVKSSKEGWKQTDIHLNPWAKLDQKELREARARSREL